MSYSVSEEYEEFKSIVGIWNDDNIILVKNDRLRIDIVRKVVDVILNIFFVINGKLL